MNTPPRDRPQVVARTEDMDCLFSDLSSMFIKQLLYASPETGISGNVTQCVPLPLSLGSKYHCPILWIGKLRPCKGKCAPRVSSAGSGFRWSDPRHSALPGASHCPHSLSPASLSCPCLLPALPVTTLPTPTLAQLLHLLSCPVPSALSLLTHYGVAGPLIAFLV